ncbi:YfhO family protein [Ruminococcus sp. Marseille-P6503]|uniref:YfhO family protein n=1 Tax=Ruminococcus sp. Marseille-P6503 TaxID=2364796 RepID=UPI000F51D65E|nr:YfhO family protein [Ruminococcus sp. Marseille-P6503]
MEKLKKLIPLIAPPLAALAIMLMVFKAGGMYPFGEGSVSWCDMNQQVVPLLMDFKDILDGKSGLFLNLNNAGGMNFYGVFFFFLASPFSLLVKFVEKGDMFTFVNILVILKLMTAAFTSALYFRVCRKGLDPGFAIALSLIYAFCGYGMLFYQNLIWLDMMYLFPLLMISLDRLVHGNSNIPYIIMVTLMMAVNYYISYMTVLFIVMFMAVYVFRYAACENTSGICVRFVSGSLIAALLSAAVWLPCFMQYLSSGRGESAMATIAGSDFVTSYKTALPLLFCSGFVFMLTGYHALRGKKRSRRTGSYLIMFALLLVPFFIEPVNLMWHTGNYMSFPARYGFITMFIGILCCAEFLEGQEGSLRKAGSGEMFAGYAGTVILLALYLSFLRKFISENFDELSHYTSSLWGNDSSFEHNAQLFTVSVIVFGALYFMFRRGYTGKRFFAIALCLAIAAESAGNVRIYMTSASARNPDKTQSVREITDLAERISDDGFYRAATDGKIMDYNMVGALGYPSLSHYTSLTDRDFMFTQKKLGYTTVWMEVGSCGGTELTDALYSVGYRIVRGQSQDAVYSNGKYSIVKLPYSIGLGLITDADLSGEGEIPSGLTRAQVQEYVFEKLFPGQGELVTEYEYSQDSIGVEKINGRYNVSSGAEIKYSFYVSGRQSIYADCFDRLSNDLKEEYFESFSIKVNGISAAGNYPTTTNNGVIKLGEFENQQVEVTLSCKKDISCYSLGVFGIDLDKLENAVEGVQSAGFTADGGTLRANCTVSGTKTCLLSVPYQEGFSIRVNGEKTEYTKAVSDFISFELKDGENEIEISFTPKGFYAGIALSLVGAAAFALYIIFRKKIVLPRKAESAVQSIVLFAVIAVMGAVYVLPVIINLSGF